MEKQSDPRFNDYTEAIDSQGNVIGFKLEEDDFVYLFDRHGGWFDRNGKYFNESAIETEPPAPDHFSDESLSDKSEEEQNYKSKSTNALANQKLRTINNLLAIIQGYSQNDKVQVQVTSNPELDDRDIELFFKQNNIQVECTRGAIVIEKQISKRVVDFQGAKVNDSLIYIDIPLRGGLAVRCHNQGNDIEISELLTREGMELGMDFANLELQDDGSVTLQISKDKTKLFEAIIDFQQV